MSYKIKKIDEFFKCKINEETISKILESASMLWNKSGREPKANWVFFEGRKKDK